MGVFLGLSRVFKWRNLVYLESLTIKNYRKFRCSDNKICFVKPDILKISDENHKVSSFIAPSTTLIVGKNNSGKTTIVNALNMLCHNQQPCASDFNLSYLKDLFKEYQQAFKENPKTNFEEIETPALEFNLKIKVNFKKDDLMTHLSPFISIGDEDDGESVSVNLKVTVQLLEDILFKKEVRNIFLNKNFIEGDKERDVRFEKFYSLLSKETTTIDAIDNLYKISFVDILGDAAEKFSLKKLINIKEIRANRHLKDGVLSDVFNKIVTFQFSNDATSRSSLESNLLKINKTITNDVGSKNSDISDVLSQIESSGKVSLNLSGNITYNDIMKGLIKYNFMDGDDYIPEDQFGLGYINLINIIGEIIHFVDSYEDKSHFSRINLLFIEEPEAFMHPQMQEFFINRIDNAVKKALEIANESSGGKNSLQCQLAITTHSSHIVNSKIHNSNTFNNINYLTSIRRCTKAVNLTDDAIVTGSDENSKQNMNFIKKHIKFKVSELFFSDAIIFVEGITEETLISYYLGKNNELSNFYVSVFNINGAHGKLYLPLAKKLSIPTVIVTDLDIKREKCERNESHKDIESCKVCKQQAKDGNTPVKKGSEKLYSQITDLNGRETTNATLQEFNKGKNKAEGNNDSNNSSISDMDYFEDDNVYLVFQKDPIHGQYATSFEEALILTNFNNNIINSVIRECKPDIYRSILSQGGTESSYNLVNNSYKLQKKLSGSKSDFSNKLLYKILTIEEEKEDELLRLPAYIEDGFKWLEIKLRGNNMLKMSEEGFESGMMKEPIHEDASYGL